MIRRTIRCLPPRREPLGKPVSLAIDQLADLRERNVKLQQLADRLRAELAYYKIKYDPGPVEGLAKKVDDDPPH